MTAIRFARSPWVRTLEVRETFDEIEEKCRMDAGRPRIFVRLHNAVDGLEIVVNLDEVAALEEVPARG